MSQKRETSDKEIEQAHATLVATFRSGRTRSVEWRKKQLEGIRRFCTERADDIAKAIKADLGRPQMEALLGDSASLVAEVDLNLANIDSWMQHSKRSTPLLQQPGSSKVVAEPKGVVLNISPWNFPVNLSLGPLIAATSAGNCSLLKPSEVSSNCEKLLAEEFTKYVDPEAIKVVRGAIPETTALLKLRWDHIFYTGSGAVGKVIMRAAAEHLTPVSLELGGKSPAVVLPSCNLKTSARRLLSGKMFNAGQICVAPDYMLVHKDVAEEFVKEMKEIVDTWFGNDAKTSDSFGRIINQHHFKRLCAMTAESGGEVVAQLGKPDESQKFMPPTIIRAPTKGSKLMTDEIFGPILPFWVMDSTSEMIDFINSGEKPLALYVFSSTSEADFIVSRVSSGGVCINDTIFHFTNLELPFGGVGASGMGRYHGKWGFEEFSHMRAVMYRDTWVDMPLRYPPYTDRNLKLFQKLMVGPLIPPVVKTALRVLGVSFLIALFVRFRKHLRA